MKRRFLAAVAVSAAVLLYLPFTMDAQYGVKTGDWPAYGGDGGSTFYSQLEQINRDNVQNLQVAWTFKTDNFAPNAVPQLQTTRLWRTGCFISPRAREGTSSPSTRGPVRRNGSIGLRRAPAATGRRGGSRVEWRIGLMDGRSASSPLRRASI